ncbi:hypothetical protein [Kribbella pratensis]|uniref:hypothetical protein n=1 Tax=Kribbella pratensis TaxID=2512112 RepID=UPI001EDE38F4|nr:hypothetical protein [Kribbella pratensis]
MTNHAPTADAIGSGGGAGGSEVIADGNGDRERLARAGLSRVVEPGDLAALKAFDGMPALEIWDRLRRSPPASNVGRPAWPRSTRSETSSAPLPPEHGS